MTQQTKCAPTRATAPYLVIEVSGPCAGLVVTDCHTRSEAEHATARLRAWNKGQDYRVIEQGQRKEAA